MPDIVGAWHLTAFDVTFSDGRDPVQPFASGQIVYSASGHMSAVLSQHAPERGPQRTATPSAAAPRARPPGTDMEGGATTAHAPLEHAVRLDDRAKAAAFDAYLSYAGRYRVEGDRVYHDVDFALAPGTVGTRLTRRFVIEGDALTLRYERVRQSGVIMQYVLRWARADAPLNGEAQ